MLSGGVEAAAAAAVPIANDPISPSILIYL